MHDRRERYVKSGAGANRAVEHPVQGQLGQRRKGMRAARHVAVRSAEPDLLDVAVICQQFSELAAEFPLVFRLLFRAVGATSSLDSGEVVSR